MKLFLLGFFLLLNSSNSKTDLKDRLQSVINKVPTSTKTSVCIVNANTGDKVFAQNIDKPMIPASNTKLFTTATALELVGPNYEFSTKILVDSLQNKKGIVEGNLYIKGFGYSTFKTTDLDSLLRLISNAGIREIKGNIIGDDTYFDKNYIRDDWIIDERANVKLPPVSALVINKNQFIISLYSTGKIGSKLKYSISPECSFIDVNISATVSRNRRIPRIRSSFNDQGLKVKVSGALRKRKTPRRYVVNIGNPPLYFALLLKEKLQQKGIKVTGKAQIGKSPETGIEIASVGIRLKKLISFINQNSDNYLAECLFKSIGVIFSGDEGNSFYATQAVLTSFSNEFIIDDATAVVDGSGISRFNTISTGSIVRLLNRIYKNNLLFEDYYRSLSITGINGTLKDRPINNFIKGNFHGKTGTLNGVSALSGYLIGRKNEMYIVSIIMEYKSRGSNYHKDIQDRLLIELTK